MTQLEDLEATFASVTERVGQSVVRLGRWRGGAGVVIAPGFVLTNAHNVREGMAVTFADGRQAEAKPAGVDIDADLAVLAVDTDAAQPVDWSDRAATIGTAVFAVTANNTGGRATFGFVSSVARPFRGPRGRRISGAIEHTAPLAPGSSGSPLVDRAGRLIGLNTNRVGNGFYLALPADESLRSRVAALQRGETTQRPRLGVGVAPSWVANRMRRAVGLAEREGVLVREVEPDSPAAGAGILVGDLIAEVAGRPIRDPDDVYDALSAAGTASAPLAVRLVRGNDEVSVEVTFGAGTAEGPVH